MNTLALAHAPLGVAQRCCGTSARELQRPAAAGRPKSAALRVCAQAQQTATVTSPAELLAAGSNNAVSAEELVLRYNRDMAERMGWNERMDNPFEYRHEGALYYHYIAPDMIVGAQPRNALDVEQLAAEGVNVILNLQQDKDLAYWKVDLNEISSAAHKHGMSLVRTPAVDFSPHSLRDTLPRAVAALQGARARGERVYVHCTAGLGRAPAVGIAALYWFSPLQLDEAYSFLTGIRPCGPNKDAIRGATYDLLSGRPKDHFAGEAPHGFATLSDHDRENIARKLGVPLPAPVHA